MKIYLGADHRGFELKESLKRWLEEGGLEVIELGSEKLEPGDDYPEVAIKVGEAVAEAVASAPSSLGILICGSGVGVNIAANKVKGIRAAQAWSVDQVEHAKQSDHINVLSLAADYLDFEQSINLISVFIDAPTLDDERFLRRLKHIAQYEERH